MSRFNTFLNSHFQSSGCILIARAFDLCRDRRVSIYAMPGYYDCCGISDGVDAWIAPASAGQWFRTATGDCHELMRMLKDGLPLPPVPDFPGAKRARVALDDDEPAPRATKRTRIVEETEEPQPRRSRHALI